MVMPKNDVSFNFQLYKITYILISIIQYTYIVSMYSIHLYWQKLAKIYNAYFESILFVIFILVFY